MEQDTRRFRETVSIAILWAFVGIAIGATLRIFQAGSGLRDLIGTLLVIAPVILLLAYAYWRHKHVVRHFIAPPGTGSGARRRIAAIWPWIAILVMVLTVVILQVGITVGHPLPPLAILLTLVLVLTAPHLDGVVTRWSERATARPDISILGLAFRRTTRFVIAIAILCLLVYLWVLPLLTALNVEASVAMPLRFRTVRLHNSDYRPRPSERESPAPVFGELARSLLVLFRPIRRLL